MNAIERLICAVGRRRLSPARGWVIAAAFAIVALPAIASGSSIDPNTFTKSPEHDRRTQHERNGATAGGESSPGGALRTHTDVPDLPPDGDGDDDESPKETRDTEPADPGNAGPPDAPFFDLEALFGIVEPNSGQTGGGVLGLPIDGPVESIINSGSPDGFNPLEPFADPLLANRPVASFGTPAPVEGLVPRGTVVPAPGVSGLLLVTGGLLTLRRRR